MQASKYQTNVMSTDVLVVGGGLAGLTTAIKIKEQQESLDVLVVDKGGIGWAGQVPPSGGRLIILPPDADLDQWVKWVVERGQYLSNQEWLYNFGGSLYESLTEVANWGLAFLKDAEGKLDMEDGQASWRVPHNIVTWVTHRVILQLKKLASAKGVNMLNKIEVVDLLKDDERIVGAVGFSILTGEFYVFKSRATVLACGPGMRKNKKLFTMCCGEGVAAAYRAGVEQLHTEFATGGVPDAKHYEVWWRGAQMRALVNNQGEYLFEKYFPEGVEDTRHIVYAMAKEVEAGRGPIYLDVTRYPEQLDAEVTSPHFRWTFAQGAFLDVERIFREKGGIDPRKQKVEYITNPGFRVGSIKVDLDCKSPLQGLWGVGDIIASGAALEGALPFNNYPGWGLPFAIVTGLKAGRNVAKLTPEAPEPKISSEQQDRLRERLFAPMTLERGFEPYDAISRIQETIIPINVYFLREGGRLKEALSKIEKVKEEVLPKVKAADPHELVKYHEAESMALCSEMTLRAALLRTESRGTHIREDYPERDDANWLKWTVIKRDGERMALSTEAIPMEAYNFKP